MKRVGLVVKSVWWRRQERESHPPGVWASGCRLQRRNPLERHRHPIVAQSTFHSFSTTCTLESPSWVLRYTVDISSAPSSSYLPTGDADIKIIMWGSRSQTHRIGRIVRISSNLLRLLYLSLSLSPNQATYLGRDFHMMLFQVHKQQSTLVLDLRFVLSLVYKSANNI